MIRNFRFLPAAAVVLFCAFPVFSADERMPLSGPEEPEQTEIILPRMYLEIEDLTIEEIDAVVPDDTAVYAFIPRASAS